MSKPLCYKCKSRVTRVLCAWPYSSTWPLGACTRHAPIGGQPLPLVGKRMLSLLLHVSLRPGLTKLAAIRASSCPNQSRGYEAIDRLEKAGLIGVGGRRNRMELATTDLGEAVISLLSRAHGLEGA